MAISTENAENAVTIPAGEVALKGDLQIPSEATGLVLFAHGSGSSRFSPRNQFVAQVLREARIATLLMDLLTQTEERLDSLTGHLRFDIGLLARRLVAATEWASRSEETGNLPLGYFGSSTGGGAALVAAAQLGGEIRAVVSRGGRPDLAGQWLSKVQCPTLLLVGGQDLAVIELNHEAMLRMTCPTQLSLIPNATHLFEEPGALESVAQQAAYWFGQHLGR